MTNLISLMDISTDEFMNLLKAPIKEKENAQNITITPKDSYLAGIEKIALHRALFLKNIQNTDIDLKLIPRGPVESFIDIIKAYEISTDILSIYYPQIGTARGSGYNTIRAMSKIIDCPIINMGSDSVKPSEGISLARYITQNIDLENKTVALTWVFGTHNEIGFVHSYVLALAHLGAQLTISSPKQFRIERKLKHAAKDIAKRNGGFIQETNDYITDADILIVANWASLDLLSSPDLHDRIRRENIERYFTKLEKETQQVILGEGIIREVSVSNEIFEQFKSTSPIGRHKEKVIAYQKIIEMIRGE